MIMSDCIDIIKRGGLLDGSELCWFGDSSSNKRLEVEELKEQDGQE